ncbi:hypothetical protein GQ53DRAFT_756522 [Thozetella sp. PMI_491]|nr:hypothetical protein GQ53DRAFT_756522 [Thozetella sp. PMI_491]
MVTQSSKRTLAQPTRPSDPARSFNERGHGLMRKIHTYIESLSEFGVEAALCIKTPHVKYTYESEDGMLHSFNTGIPERNQFRPIDVERLFRGRPLVCPSIHSLSPLRGRSGSSSPTPSTSSASSASLPAAETGLTLPAPPPTQGLGLSLPSTGSSPTLVSASPPPQPGLGLSLPSARSSPTLWSDSPPPLSPVMDISSLLNSDPWPVASDAPFSWSSPLVSPRVSPSVPDETPRPLTPPPMSRPTRLTTPRPSPRGPSPFRIMKIRSPPRVRRK